MKRESKSRNKQKGARLSVSVILCVFFIVTGCENSKESDENSDNGVEPTSLIDPMSLIDTRWKLTGIIGVETEVFRELERQQSCDICYTLSFETDSVYYDGTNAVQAGWHYRFNGYSSKNILSCPYRIDYETGAFQIIHMGGSEAGEVPDGQLYKDALYDVQSFTLQNNELTLYYNNKKNFLKFKQSKESDIENSDNGELTSLLGTNWKLTGIKYVSTEVLKELEPQNCIECYTLSFDGDSCYNETTYLNGKIDVQAGWYKVFTGYSTSNFLSCWYSVDYKTDAFQIYNVGGTKVGEILDGQLYVDALYDIQSFSIQENELRLYFDNEKKFCFIFKQLNNQ